MKNKVVRFANAFWSINWFLRVGIGVFIISGALDLSYHILSSFWPDHLDAYFGPDGYYTHLALFIGMVLIVIGVILTKPQLVQSAEIRTVDPSYNRR